MSRLYRIYCVRLKGHDGKYILKYGITHTTTHQRIMREHLPKYGNGKPMFEYFESYKVVFETDTLFTRSQAEAVEDKLRSITPRDFYTPWGKENHVDGITEMRKYTPQRLQLYADTINAALINL